MNQRIAGLLVSATLLTFTHGALAGQAKWTKEGTKAGVTVYTSPVEGSDVPRVKAVTTLDATTDEVWEVFNSVLSKSKGVKEIKKLGSCGDGCEYIYQRLGHALIKDRHYVLKMKSTITEKNGMRTYKRIWHKTDEKKPIGSGAIPIEKISGSWTLAPVDEGRATRITYTNHMDLGGSVPAALFSAGFVENAFKILSSFRTAL